MKINARRGGFTLVEIMIVVAIIALLASIAVPNFLRARLRSQATIVKQEIRMVDAAVDQYAIEKNLSNGALVTWPMIKSYIKENSPMYTNAGKDSLGNLIVPAAGLPVGTAIAVPAASYTALSDVADATFWAPYTTGT